MPDTTTITTQELSLRLSGIEKQVAGVADRLDRFEGRQPFTVHIVTLAPEPYRLLRDLPVLIEPTGDDYVATFFDAGISATGDTEEEALFNLKDILIQKIKVLGAMPERTLGAAPKQQLAVLRSLIKETA